MLNLKKQQDVSVGVEATKTRININYKVIKCKVYAKLITNCKMFYPTFYSLSCALRAAKFVLFVKAQNYPQIFYCMAEHLARDF